MILNNTFSETAVLMIDEYFNSECTYSDSEVFKRSNEKLVSDSELKEKKEKKREKKEKKENVKMFYNN